MLNAADTNWVIEVTDATFEEEVLERSNQVPVVIDFWAEWCQYCHVLAPHLVAQAIERQGAFVLAKINVDENPEWAGQLQISGLPAVRVLHYQQMIDGFDGALPEEAVREFIDRILPSEIDRMIQQGEILEKTNPTEAEALFRSVLETDPNSELAKIGLARVLVETQRGDDAKPILATLGVSDRIGQEAERLRRILEMRQGREEQFGDERKLRQRVEAEPENATARHELGALLASQERYPEALEELLAAAKLDRKLASNEVRELMVKIFQIIGVRSEMSEKYRDELRALLY